MQNCTTILGIIDMRQRGISYDDCRNRYHIGCSTISLIMSRFHACGKDLDTLKQMSAEEVEYLFFPPENLRRKDDSVMPDYQMVYDRLTAPGSKANLFYLWLKYKKECPSGYQYTQYCLHFKRFVEKNYGSEAVSMVVERIPGEKVYIDWIGDQPEILMDSITGELKKVHFFVTTVGVSNLVYAEAFEDEKLPSFIAGTVHALESYGALPKYLVPDNLKTAITRHTKDELVINSAYQDLENFYDVVILPPPPRKPKGKPTVEKYVQFLETHLLEDLKEKVYYSIEDINRDVCQKIADINNGKKTPQSLSKMESFLRYDKPQMKPLAGESFVLCDYKYFARVPNNYHLLYDDHYYSVLYTYYNQPAILKATMAEIRICDRNNKLICTHRRSYKEFPKYITRQEHMTPEHQYYKIQKMVLTTGAGLPISVHIWRSLLIRYYLHHSTKSRHTTAVMASCICHNTDYDKDRWLIYEKIVHLSLFLHMYPTLRQWHITFQKFSQFLSKSLFFTFSGTSINPNR